MSLASDKQQKLQQSLQNLPRPLDLQKELYRGSVKNLYQVGFAQNPDSSFLLFEFTDDYSVFDWGKMPDPIPQKGFGLSKLAQFFFQKLGDAKEWQGFLQTSATQQAIEELKKNNSPESVQKTTDQLSKSGLDSHYLKNHNQELLTANNQDPFLFVSPVQVFSPAPAQCGPFAYFNYDHAKSQMGSSDKSFLIPLEVVFRFELGEGSSFLKRHPDSPFKAGHRFTVPYVEFFTKLEPQDRSLSLSEAQQISGLSIEQFNQLYLKNVFTCLFLKSLFASKNINLVDGKLEWALATGQDNSAEKNIILVDAIGPDELRLEYQNFQLSKEVLRKYYRYTSWYQDFEKFKMQNPSIEKKHHAELPQPPPLSKDFLNLMTNMYKSLSNTITGENIFDSPSLEKIVQDLKQKMIELSTQSKGAL
ncbi:MAG: phosphoribosylaminoimidazolesuccinocarboxamide synthase [Pseudobdellovibrionaceae bacterium]